MSESAHLPMNFGGIADEELSGFENARVVVWPVSYEGTVSYGSGTGAGAQAVVDASRNMELYDEETDAERSEEHTSELQSRQYLVCRLLLEKKKKKAQH